MRQPEETLIARLSSRDNREIKRDNINLTLDTSGEGRYGYWFGINLGDTQMDGTLLPERQFSNDWDGAWRGQPRHLRMAGALRCLFPGELSQCRKWRASGALGSYVSLRCLSRRALGLASTALDGPKVYFSTSINHCPQRRSKTAVFSVLHGRYVRRD